MSSDAAPAASFSPLFGKTLRHQLLTCPASAHTTIWCKKRAKVASTPANRTTRGDLNSCAARLENGSRGIFLDWFSPVPGHYSRASQKKRMRYCRVCHSRSRPSKDFHDGANAGTWLKPGAWGRKAKGCSQQIRRGPLRKLRRALTVRTCISQGVAATKRFA